MKSALKIALLSAVYFAFHSITASFRAKESAAKIVGERNRDGWFRLVYSVVAASGLVALFFAGRALPDQKWYRVKGLALVATSILQLLSVLMIVDATKRVRGARLFGFENAERWLNNKSLQLPPESQTPRADELSHNRDLERDGVFAMSRNAFNFAVIPFFCAWPRMTRNYATFCAIMTAYCVLGSYLGELRMKARYGDSWEDYKKSGVPFMIPSFPKKDAAREQS